MLIIHLFNITLHIKKYSYTIKIIIIIFMVNYLILRINSHTNNRDRNIK